jgi:redox-sensitive bicupin YhaK (pirin superfamily)
MIEMLIHPRRRDLGGFEVSRVLPHARHRMVGPFIFFDHMGPVEFSAGIPRSADVRPHPHIGLSTITYLFAGEIMHRDSVGSVQPILPGEVNWMTAGRGITHSERFERARREGGPMHGIQAWVALPQAQEECDPGFSHHGGGELPQLDDGGLRLRLVAGTAFGMTSPVQTHSPLFYVHGELRAGASMPVPAGYAEKAVYGVRGDLAIDGAPVAAGQMAVLRTGAESTVTASTDAVFMLLGGEPVGKRFIDWNFVSSSKERIEQAKADWVAGRMKLPDADDEEFIPLPGSPAAAEPMS